MNQIYSNIIFYKIPTNKINGSLSITRSLMSVGLYFKPSNVENQENPFLENAFILNPFSDPFKEKNGHILIDLSYFSEFTVMGDPPRLCFHDSTEDPSISFNFPSKNYILEFLNDLKTFVTLTEHDLPGYYKIVRFSPQFLPFKTPNLPEISDSITYFQLHSSIISQIISDKSSNTNSQINLKNIDELKNYLKNNVAPLHLKAQVWSLLSGIGDLSNINPFILQTYEKIKDQWSKICYSQTQRSSKFMTSAVNLSETILKLKQKFLTIIPNPKILISVFNVIMSICQVYNVLNNKQEDLLYILRVFIALFSRKILIQNDEIFYIINNDITLSLKEFETCLFWSIIILLEKGEAKFLLISNNSNEKKFNILKNYLLNIFPHSISLINSKGNPIIGNTVQMIDRYGSCILPLCDCADLWIAALASNKMLDFLYSSIITAFLYHYPNLHSSPTPINYEETIIQSFIYWDHISLISSTFQLINKIDLLLIEKK